MGDAARAPLALIWAMDRGRCIGKGGALPWHFSEDLQHFKRTTKGHAVIMGRLTWASLGKPLPGRRNLVVTRDVASVPAGAEAFSSVEAAIAAARATDPMPFIIGGAQLYAATLPLATRLHITEVNAQADGDTFFPAFDLTPFRETERREGETPELTFLTYERA